MNTESTLSDLRAEIDGIDRELVALFARRMAVSRRIARWKTKNGYPVYDRTRETEKLAALAELCPGEAVAVTALYRTVFSLSRDAQWAEKEAGLRCGLLGEHLSHSYSPAIHAALGHYAYTLCPLPPEQVADFIRTGDWTGLNVTIPYKKTVLPLCDSLSPVAQKAGSVNTLVRRDGKIYGYNTDAYGFASLLAEYGIRPAGRKVLLLGDGGASATVQSVLHEMGAQTVVISRRGEVRYNGLADHRNADLIVNATPVGMYPQNGATLLHPADFPRCRAVIDLIYNPAKTQLLLEAEAAGIQAVNGLWMLVAQAAKSAALFTGRTADPTNIREIYTALRRQMQNIVLIGMPGSGKTTVAQVLGQLTGRPVCDADEEYTRRFGETPAQTLCAAGEPTFRAREAEVLADLCRESGQVIATGGGSILLPENALRMRQNGTLVWLRRPLGQLAIEDRPLSGNGGVERLYARREPLYRRLADFAVDNDENRTPEAVAEEIWKQFTEKSENCSC